MSLPLRSRSHTNPLLNPSLSPAIRNNSLHFQEEFDEIERGEFIPSRSNSNGLSSLLRAHSQDTTSTLNAMLSHSPASPTTTTTTSSAYSLSQSHSFSARSSGGIPIPHSLPPPTLTPTSIPIPISASVKQRDLESRRALRYQAPKECEGQRDPEEERRRRERLRYERMMSGGGGTDSESDREGGSGGILRERWREDRKRERMEMNRTLDGVYNDRGAGNGYEDLTEGFWNMDLEGEVEDAGRGEMEMGNPFGVGVADGYFVHPSTSQLLPPTSSSYNRHPSPLSTSSSSRHPPLSPSSQPMTLPNFPYVTAQDRRKGMSHTSGGGLNGIGQINRKRAVGNSMGGVRSLMDSSIGGHPTSSSHHPRSHHPSHHSSRDSHSHIPPSTSMNTHRPSGSRAFLIRKSEAEDYSNSEQESEREDELERRKREKARRRHTMMGGV